MARSPVGERIYATLWRSTTTTPPLPAQIAIINTETNQIEDRITLTGDMLPSAPAISPDAQLLYFADESQGLVVVDLAGKSILERIPAARAGNPNNQFTSLALSPDGLILCLTDSAGVALLDTRTRTFIARINLTLMKRSIPPVFHPNGSLFYLVDRRTVSGSTAVSLVSYNTSDLSEAARVTLPATFDPYNAIVTPHGASLALDGLLRPAGQPARGVLLMVDLVRNRLTSTNESVEPTVGALGVVVR
jgi:DNA-binding beta-propeller fold protein YncE